MSRLLLIKTGALGDVLRTTSLLPGLAECDPGLEVTWVTARGAAPLLERHPLVHRILEVDPSSEAELDGLAQELGGQVFDRVLSLDDELPLCALGTAVAARSGAALTGACLDEEGRPTFTKDAACWFGMGLLCREGLEEADRRKLANRRTHAELLAEVAGVRPDRPRLELSTDEQARGRELAAGLAGAGGPLVGLNTGAGGRWTTKAMRVDEVVRLVEDLAAEQPAPRFLLLGGPEEHARNADLAQRIREQVPSARLAEAPLDLTLRGFAALVGALDLLVTSDSLALHMGVARARRVVAFFAPTSPHEIDLFGRGEKVVSTAPDAGSYRRDADNASLTGARVAAAARRQLGASG